MLSKNQLKYIQSLHQKKYRQQQGAFLVEGAKSVQEVLQSDFRLNWWWLPKHSTKKTLT